MIRKGIPKGGSIRLARKGTWKEFDVLEIGTSMLEREGDSDSPSSNPRNPYRVGERADQMTHKSQCAEPSQLRVYLRPPLPILIGSLRPTTVDVGVGPV
jgi:hypothetical protein